MSFKHELNTLLTKEMDRKTFLKHITFAILMLTGANVFIKLVGSMNKGTLSLTDTSTPQTTRPRSGYGRIGYGTKLESEG